MAANAAKIKKYSDNGVVFLEPNSVVIGEDVIIGEGTVVYPGAIIGSHTKIGENCVILPYSYIDNSVINDEAKIGPHAYIRSNSLVGKKCEIGAYVEVNRSTIGEQTNIKHLSYIGDGKIGSNVNIGAGVVFANYDGKDKHGTFVLDGAFIGSNSTMIAPVKIGEKAVIGAGTIVNKDVKNNEKVVNKIERVNLK